MSSPWNRLSEAPIVAWLWASSIAAGVSDGAAAAIVVRADMAKNFRSRSQFTLRNGHFRRGASGLDAAGL